MFVSIRSQSENGARYNSINRRSVILILAHRGYWETPEEKNSLGAFERSFILGFGAEIDIRDYQGQIVVSHDIADSKSVKLEEVFRLYPNINSDLPIALNIKADGLQQKLKWLLEKFRITNYFVFDMSLPDALIYLEYGINTFTRMSEYERKPLFFEKATGVWLDCFNKEWANKDIQYYLYGGKKVCLVSPELHKREYLPSWQRLASMKIVNDEQCMICTDYPEEAKEVFNGQN